MYTCQCEGFEMRQSNGVVLEEVVLCWKRWCCAGRGGVVLEELLDVWASL